MLEHYSTVYITINVATIPICKELSQTDVLDRYINNITTAGNILNLLPSSFDLVLQHIKKYSNHHNCFVLQEYVFLCEEESFPNQYHISEHNLADAD